MQEKSLEITKNNKDFLKHNISSDPNLHKNIYPSIKNFTLKDINLRKKIFLDFKKDSLYQPKSNLTPQRINFDENLMSYYKHTLTNLISYDSNKFADQTKKDKNSKKSDIFFFIYQKCISLSLKQLNLLLKNVIDVAQFKNIVLELFSLFIIRNDVYNNLKIKVNKNIYIPFFKLSQEETFKIQKFVAQNLTNFIPSKFINEPHMKTLDFQLLYKNYKFFGYLFDYKNNNQINTCKLKTLQKSKNETFKIENNILTKPFEEILNPFYNESSTRKSLPLVKELKDQSFNSAIKNSSCLHILRNINAEKIMPFESDVKKQSPRKSLAVTIDKDPSSFQNMSDHSYAFNLKNECDNSSEYCSDSNTDSDEKYEEEEFLPNPHEIYESKLYSTKKFVRIYKDANSIGIFNSDSYFKKKFIVTFFNSENDEKNFPDGFSFSSGWHKYRTFYIIQNKSKFKNSFLLLICKEYKLEKYFSLIFNMIRTNTYTLKNSCNSFCYFFHLICYHLCTKWNLGIGKNCKANKYCKNNEDINNKKYFTTFKTKEFWYKKANNIFDYAKKRALKELEISESSFTVTHLYNLLLFHIPFNPKTIAFICFVHHATIPHELDNNLNNIQKKYWDSAITKRKILKKINSKYKQHMYNVNINLPKFIHNFLF
ncbi:hypothetical protein NUSPORA_01149 [Nucleospora cyclopteri]